MKPPFLLYSFYIDLFSIDYYYTGGIVFWYSDHCSVGIVLTFCWRWPILFNSILFVDHLTTLQFVTCHYTFIVVRRGIVLVLRYIYRWPLMGIHYMMIPNYRWYSTRLLVPVHLWFDPVWTIQERWTHYDCSFQLCDVRWLFVTPCYTWYIILPFYWLIDCFNYSHCYGVGGTTIVVITIYRYWNDLVTILDDFDYW